MKIDFVTATLTSGGSERVISLLANALCAKGHEVSIVCLNSHIVYYSIDPKVTVVFAEDEIQSTSLLEKTIWLRNYIKDNKPDVVVPFMEAVYCVTLLALIGVRVPVVSSERIDPRRSPFVRNILRRIFLPLTTHLVVQTQDIKNFYPGFIRKKTSVIYNPVSENVFSMPIADKRNTIISVGRLYKQKNQQMLIRAFKEIADAYPDYKLVIFGEGPLRKELETTIEELHLVGKVLLPGVTDNVIEKLTESKLFCLSSDYEGMSNALIEAICVGLPVITTQVSGVEELIESGKNGETVKIGDTTSFAKAMNTMLADEEKMKNYGAANKQMASLFKTENIVERWELLLKQVKENYG